METGTSARGDAAVGTHRMVRLTHEGTEAVIAEGEVYFSFASGRLSYDCVSCGSRCCRGHGYLAAVGPELERQIKSRPYLPMFMDQGDMRIAGQMHVRNLAPGCFFLDDSGLCEVHAEHGYSAKPETCRLFPFNGLLRFGQYLIVRPHQQLCPLGVVSHAATPSGASTYSALMDAMSEQGVAASMRHVSAAPDQAARRIECEREIILRSEKWLSRADYLGFAEEQLRTEMEAGLIGWTEPQESIQGAVVFASKLLGTPTRGAAGGDGRLEETMVALTAYFRSLALFHDDGALTSEDGLVRIAPRTLPDALATLYLLAEAARVSGTRSITFQTVSALHAEFLPLMSVVACRDMIVSWRKGVPLDIGGFGSAGLQPAFVRLARALLPAAQRGRQRSLGELLLEHAPSDALQRIIFLKEIGRKVLGKLVAIQQEPLERGARGIQQRVFGTMERWALRAYNDDRLNVLYSRKRAEGP